MNKKVKTSIQVVTAIICVAVLFCLMTPRVEPVQKSAHGEDSYVTTEITTGVTTTETTSTTTTSTTTSTSTTTTVPVTTTGTTVAVEKAESTVTATETAVIKEEETKIETTTTCDSVPVIPESVTVSISDYDYTLLCKITANEYGGMADVYERAKVVASVMNMVNDSRWPNTVEAVLDRSCAPWGFNKYNEYFCSGTIHYSSMSDAVDYYLNNPDVFADWTCNQWYGNGRTNTFYTI